MDDQKLSGTWKLEVRVGGQVGTATFELLEEADGTLSGTYTGRLGRGDVSGSVSRDKVEFGFDGYHGRVSYRGLHEDGQLRGTCTYAGLGDGSFEGRRAGE